MSWTIKMTAKAEKEFLSMCQSGELSHDDLNIIRTWLNEMEENGPEFIAKSKLWGDHPLYNEWEGYRASCFSNPGRIIYKVKDREVIVEVNRVTTDHNYRKGD